jgi:NMD protein affecting ribosome stability and mRNA decay
VLNYVKNEIEKAGNVFISKEIYKKFGTDLYLTNKFFLIQLGKKLKNRFSGTITRSRSLYKTNRMTSKLVYRTTICFRLIEEDKLNFED